MTSLAPDGRLPVSGKETPASSRLGNQAPSKGLDPKILEGAIDDPTIVAQFLLMKQEQENDKKWADWVEREFVKCKNARIPFERQWFLNLAFVAGKQYVAPLELAGQGFKLSSPAAPPWRVRLVINKIRTAIRTECAKLTSSKPIPTVMPSTSENEDLSASRVAEMLLKNHFRTAEFEKMYRSWIWWGVVCGNSFIKSYWDPQALDYNAQALPEPPTLPDGSPVPPQVLALNPKIQAFLNTPQPAKGKICTERVNPFHIYVPDLLNEDLEDQPYLIHTTAQHPLAVKQKYKIDATPDVRATNTVLEAATIIAKNTEQHLDAVQVKEVWLKPNAHPDFPDGGMLTVINGKVVQKLTSWPWPFREFPFYKYDGIPTGGFYSDSIVVDLIPLQKEYNRTRSQIIEIKNTMGKPKLVYQAGSINPRKISSEPGQSIPYVAGYQPPIVVPGAEVPATMVNEISTLTAEFDDISGQHEITRGSTPSQVTSGTAIAFLQEQDDTKLSYQVHSVENCTEILGRHYLEYVAKYWDDYRIIKITGREATYESVKWKGSDLKGNTDVKVQSGSALPYSKAAKQAFLQELMTAGHIDPTTGLELMEFPALNKAMDDLLMDKRQAQRENAKMADLTDEIIMQYLQPPVGPNGEPAPQVSLPDGSTASIDPNTGQPWRPTPPVPVNSWDNHEAHVLYHNEFRKSQEFELLSDGVKQAFELHVQMHQFALMSQMINAQGMPVGPQQPLAPTEPGASEDVPPEQGQEQMPA